MKWYAIIAACLVAVSATPRGQRISNTTQCEDLGGSCSLPADCNLSTNVCRGRCDNTNFSCCIPKDKLCAAMKGECLSEVECSAKSDCRATPLPCSGGVCCVRMRSSPRNGGDRTGQGNGRKNGRRMGQSGNRPGRRIISNKTECEDFGGSCSLPADCDLATNVFRGRCDNTSFGCCISKDKLCAAMKGECLSEVECSAKSDCRATPLPCSGGVCCVPMRSSPRNGGDRKGQGNGRKNVRRMGQRGNRPGRRIISNTTECEDLGGSCSLPADCDLATNVFRGRCDNTSFGCCISKDELCAAMKGECLSTDECSAKSGCHPTRLSCSGGVCCVPRRSPQRQRDNGRDQNQGDNRQDQRQCDNCRDQDRRDNRPDQRQRDNRRNQDQRDNRPNQRQRDNRRDQDQRDNRPDQRQRDNRRDQDQRDNRPDQRQRDNRRDQDQRDNRRDQDQRDNRPNQRQRDNRRDQDQRDCD